MRRWLSCASVVACSATTTPPALPPPCAVPEPAGIAAGELLLERSRYGMSSRRHVFVMRDGRVQVRIDKASINGGLVCRTGHLSAAERESIEHQASGLCTWPVGKEQAVMDQGRLEFRSWDGHTMCKRNEATTSITPTWDGPDWNQAEPAPLPKWGELMKALDVLEAKLAPGD